jgi:quercetin dioxygenase-like cupin family protein
MRWFVTGTDAVGHSCVVRQEEMNVTGGLDAQVVFETAGEVLDSDTTVAGELDIAPTSGTARWTVVAFPPGSTHPSHNTRSIDFDTVLSGSIELGLDDGDHRLDAGDCVVITGIDHAWRAGPDGCTMSVLMLGVARRH